MLQGGAADLLSSGRSILAVLGPPGLCLSGGEVGSWAVSPAPCAPGLRSCICAPGHAAPSARSRRPSPSELLRVQPCALQPFRELGALPRAQVSVSVLGSLRASPPSWGPSLTAVGTFPPGKIGTAPASLGRSSPVLGTLALASAWLLAGPLPLGGLFFFISFSPSSYLIEGQTLLTVAFQLVSL